MKSKDNLILIESLISANKLDEAELLLERLLKLHKNSSEILSKLTVINFIKNNNQKAVYYFHRSIDSNPFQPGLLNNYALYLFNLKKFDDALKYSNRAIELDKFNPNYYFIKANILKSLNDYDNAIFFYKQTIKLNPKFIDSYINISNIYNQKLLITEALFFLNEARKLKNDYYPIDFNEGLILYSLKKFKEALIRFNKVILLNPKHSEAYYYRALIFQEHGNYTESIESYNYAINLQPLYYEALNDRGRLFQELRRFDDALEDYRNALNIEPTSNITLNNIASLYKLLKRYDDALIEINKCINSEPNNCIYLNTRALIYIDKGRYDDALFDINSAIQINEKYSEAYNSKAILLWKTWDLQNALTQINKSIEFNSANYLARVNKALILLDLNEPDYAIDVLKGLLTEKSCLYTAKYNLALIYLRQKSFKLGWSLYKSRWLVAEFNSKRFASNKPLIKNFLLKNKKILIWSEQGLGDQILYSSIFSDLPSKENEIIVSIDPRLLSIFKRSFSEINFISNKIDLNDISFDYHLPLADLGFFFRSSSGAFNSKPYLKVDSSYMTMLNKNFYFNCQQIANKKLVCGISWKSQREYLFSKNIDLKVLLPLLKLKNLSFVNLQYGDTAQDRNKIKNEFSIDIEHIAEIDNFYDIEGLFWLVNKCDFIITTSNVTAHIAGALGKKTYLLLNNSAHNIWYWHENEINSSWYPSIKIFRQDKNGCWQSAINQIKESIYARPN